MTQIIKLLLLSTEPTNIDMALELIMEKGTGKDWLEELFIAYQYIQNKEQKKNIQQLVLQNGSSQLQDALAWKNGMHSASDKKITEYLYKLSQNTGMDILRMAFAIFCFTSKRQECSAVKFIFENGESWMKQAVIEKLIDSNGAIKLEGWRYDLHSLPEELGEFPQIRSLILCNTKFQKIPDVVLKLTNLEVLDFCFGNIDELPEGIAALRSLRQLNLDSCPVKEFPAAICTLAILEELYLRNPSDKIKDGFNSLPPAIASLKALRVLNLSGNPIGQFPQELLELTNLQTLDLRDTLLNSLPEDIDKLTSCRELLAGNRNNQYIPKQPKNNVFTKLPDAILKMQNLRKLELPGTCNISDNIRQLEKSTGLQIEVIP